MVELEFFQAKEDAGGVKLTVQKTGRLGFSKGAARHLNLSTEKYCKFGQRKEDPNDEDFYMVITEHPDEHAFKISKAGPYFYIKGKQLLTDMGIDYQDDTQTIIFDIQEVDGEQGIYRLKKRIRKKV